MQLKLGARFRSGAIKLAWHDYVNASVLAAPPDQFGHDKLIGPNWGGLGNIQTAQFPNPVSDCAIADAIHQHMLWSAEAGVAYPWTDGAAVAAYTAVTGYNPAGPFDNAGNNLTDAGTDLPTLIQHRLTHGILDAAGRAHRIGAVVELPTGDWEALIYALYYADGVTIGVAMPTAWSAAFAAGDYLWDKVPNPEIEGGHAVTGVAFYNKMARPVTWGTDEVNLTQAGYEQASIQTYAYWTVEKLHAGLNIDGIDGQKLLHDLPLLADITDPPPIDTAAETNDLQAAIHADGDD